MKCIRKFYIDININKKRRNIDTREKDVLQYRKNRKGDSI